MRKVEKMSNILHLRWITKYNHKIELSISMLIIDQSFHHACDN